jgi:hypothetical protein
MTGSLLFSRQQLSLRRISLDIASSGDLTKSAPSMHQLLH